MKLPWVSRKAHLDAVDYERNNAESRKTELTLFHEGEKARLVQEISTLRTYLLIAENQIAKLKGELTAELHAQGRPAKGKD